MSMLKPERIRKKRKQELEEIWIQNPAEEKLYENVWRFVVGNIGTLPSIDSPTGLWKIDTWRELVMKSDINILTEINKDMGKVRETNKIEDITKGWWKGTMVRTEYLIEDEYPFRDQRQQGGVAMIMNGPSITHIIEQGGDSRKLGRWRWVVCRGKQECKTCIIGCYKPGATWVAAFNQSVALQRKRKQGEAIQDPLALWISDITTLIRMKQKEGCEIVLTGDFNEDLQNAKSNICKMALNLGLREALLEKYLIPQGFSTYARGSRIIDGVFISKGLCIEKAGYTSFDESPSDHRWIWFDIKVSNVVGDTLADRARPLERKATSKVPSIKEAFNRILNDLIAEHKLEVKVQKFVLEVNKQMIQHEKLDGDLQLLMDRLNDTLSRLIKAADTKCQKGRLGNIPFSPIVNQARGAIRILQLIFRRWKEKGKKSRPKISRIRRLVKRYGYDGPLNFLSIHEIQQALTKALNHYRVLRPYAQQYRETYLGQIAEEMSQHDGKDMELHFHRLMEQEDMRRQYKRIKQAERRPNRTGVQMVEVDIDGKRVRLTDKYEIEQAIIAANKEKLLQANNTPLRLEPLQSLVGEQMDYDKWEKILQGNINLPEEGIEEGTRLWYDFIKSQTIKEFSIKWTPEEYLASWKKMKEDKSSAPGIHIGHIKCIDPCSPAAYVVSTLALIPLQTGYAPAIWRIGVDSMIPKKLSDMRPEKLRLILLMDARFNHNNKLIGKKILEYGEQHRTLADEQYGSRKNKSSIQHAFNKRLILDHIRQYRKKAIYCANDARSCYDRILFIVAYLTLRINGVPKEAARCSVDTICHMKHYIRTVFGDSKDYYGGDKWLEDGGVFPHGNGQGNGNGPSLWSCISSPLLNILREEGFGISFDAPISRQRLDLSAIGYVDDMDYIQTEPRNTSMNIQQLQECTQSGLDLWDGMLRTTGGSLEIDKTKTDCVGINFTPRNGILVMSDAPFAQPLEARDTTGVRQPLTQISINDARKTLGIYQSPTGSETRQYQYLMEKASSWAANVFPASISRSDILKASVTTIGRTLEYPLPATSLSETQCNRIMSILLRVALPKIGYARTTSRALVFSPILLMGCGVNNLYVQQLISHISMMLDHGSQNSLTGRLIRIVAEGLYIESGYGGD